MFYSEAEMSYLLGREKEATRDGAGKWGKFRRALNTTLRLRIFYCFLYFVLEYFNLIFQTFFLLRLSSARPEGMVVK